eukprot:1090314-Prymnesium_polylepis.1
MAPARARNVGLPPTRQPPQYLHTCSTACMQHTNRRRARPSRTACDAFSYTRLACAGWGETHRCARARGGSWNRDTQTILLMWAGVVSCPRVGCAVSTGCGPKPLPSSLRPVPHPLA